MSKKLNSKAISFEYACKIYNSSKVLKTLFDNMINELNLIDNYKNFEDYQRFIFSFIGESNTNNRSNFENRLINEKHKTSNTYHNLLRLIKQKNKHFEQDC